MITNVKKAEEIIIELLLVSQDRTTDILEIITNEKLQPKILKQMDASELLHKDKHSNSQLGAGILLRETCLYTSISQRLVSHNSGLICQDLVPSELYTGITEKKRGIGDLMASIKVATTRNIIECGYRENDKLTDIFGNRVTSHFEDTEALIPFKKYELTFNGHNQPGIYLLEYFNPQIVGS
ncbi:hypothetical protein [Metabacillus malikii]|uniref:DUF98 domain-containing protein n=1 Tax=Metabacillus malikii TaxID=1504265 RepID=A0ABT9ZA09_9BACI|nr:hypothetical protein [Metabacillus malikii]MDQ0229081.1 hypothetical protein [Metabacillus malikii]